jgi:hypothetical protein
MDGNVMEENKEDLYITKTNLLSCEDVVSYLWNKCDRHSDPFKPNNAVTFSDKILFSDKIDGDLVKKEYNISGSDIRHMALKNHQEYDVDLMEFETFDAEKNSLSKGKLVIIYRPIEKFYYILRLDNEKDLTLLVKCIQKKHLFASFPTETIQFF